MRCPSLLRLPLQQTFAPSLLCKWRRVKGAPLLPKPGPKQIVRCVTINIGLSCIWNNFIFNLGPWPGDSSQHNFPIYGEWNPQLFWQCHEYKFAKTIQTIPHNRLLRLGSIYYGSTWVSFNPVYREADLNPLLGCRVSFESFSFPFANRVLDRIDSCVSTTLKSMMNV